MKLCGSEGGSTSARQSCLKLTFKKNIAKRRHRFKHPQFQLPPPSNLLCLGDSETLQSGALAGYATLLNLFSHFLTKESKCCDGFSMSPRLGFRPPPSSLLPSNLDTGQRSIPVGDPRPREPTRIRMESIPR